MKTPSSIAALEKKFSMATSSFSSNARRAMTANPDYFLWWYTVKSIALVAAIGTAAYYAGKASGMREAR